jgi:hypothetical protein
MGTLGAGDDCFGTGGGGSGGFGFTDGRSRNSTSRTLSLCFSGATRKWVNSERKSSWTTSAAVAVAARSRTLVNQPHHLVRRAQLSLRHCLRARRFGFPLASFAAAGQN